MDPTLMTHLNRAVEAHEALQDVCEYCEEYEENEMCDSCPVQHALRMLLGEIAHLNPDELGNEEYKIFRVIDGGKE